MASTLVLCDVDLTLITADGEEVPSELRNVAAAVQQRGVVLGLCSDSSVDNLRNRARSLEFGGPIIAERGAIWLADHDAPQEFLGPWHEYFAELRKRVQTACSQHDAFTTLVGDASQVEEYIQLLAAAGTRHIIINTLRQASVSIYAKRLAEGRILEFDLELLATLEGIVKRVMDEWKPAFPFYWDRNDKYSILIVGAKRATKNLGVVTTLARARYDRVIMIGNEMADVIGDDRVEQWAVGNADGDYKDCCSQVSIGTYTAGVEEFLRTLL